MVSANWSSIARDIKIGYADEEQIIIEYDDMAGTIQIKQASVTLISYPLGWKINDQQALNDMAFVSLPFTLSTGRCRVCFFSVLFAYTHSTRGLQQLMAQP